MADFAINRAEIWTVQPSPGDHVLVQVREPTGASRTLRAGDVLPCQTPGGHSLLVRRTVPGAMQLSVRSAAGHVAWLAPGSRQEYTLTYLVR